MALRMLVSCCRPDLPLFPLLAGKIKEGLGHALSGMSQIYKWMVFKGLHFICSLPQEEEEQEMEKVVEGERAKKKQRIIAGVRRNRAKCRRQM